MLYTMLRNWRYPYLFIFLLLEAEGGKLSKRDVEGVKYFRLSVAFITIYMLLIVFIQLLFELMSYYTVMIDIALFMCMCFSVLPTILTSAERYIKIRGIK